MLSELLSEDVLSLTAAEAVPDFEDAVVPEFTLSAVFVLSEAATVVVFDAVVLSAVVVPLSWSRFARTS